MILGKFPKSILSDKCLIATDLIDYLTMTKFDLQGMHKVYDTWPEITKQSFESKNQPVNFDKIDHIVFAGMGGSGVIGNIFYSILSSSISWILLGFNE